MNLKLPLPEDSSSSSFSFCLISLHTVDEMFRGSKRMSKVRFSLVSKMHCSKRLLHLRAEELVQSKLQLPLFIVAHYLQS